MPGTKNQNGCSCRLLTSW